MTKTVRSALFTRAIYAADTRVAQSAENDRFRLSDLLVGRVTPPTTSQPFFLLGVDERCGSDRFSAPAPYIREMPTVIVEKVICYVVQDDVILVFRHLDHPLTVTGVQVPAGTVEPDEDAVSAAVREVLEETGIPARVVRQLGTGDYDMRPYRDEIAHRTFVQLAPVIAQNVSTRWTAGETDPADGSALESWECWWMPIKQAHVLAGGQGALLGLIR